MEHFHIDMSSVLLDSFMCTSCPYKTNSYDYLVYGRHFREPDMGGLVELSVRLFLVSQV